MRILLVAQEDWFAPLNMPEYVKYDWYKPSDVENALQEKYEQFKIEKEALNKEDSPTKKKPKRLKVYDVALLDDLTGIETGNILTKYVQPYTLLYNESLEEQTKAYQHLFRLLLGIPYTIANRQDLLNYLISAYGKIRHGVQLDIKKTMINPYFSGEKQYEGNAYLHLSGDFGEDYTQTVTYLYNIFVDVHEPIELWPEFICDKEVDILYKVRIFGAGSLYGVIDERVLTKTDLAKPAIFEAKETSITLSISVYLRGKGHARIGNMHYRPSRLGAGQFIPGGKIFSDKNRQEFIHYFSPGDLKPPLNVYFSGYRPAEGFEGYWMMKNLKSPFLLFGDPRLEGGAFYLGSPEYEREIKRIILNKLVDLGFKETDLVLSGLSMGTFGALYYGAQLNPAAIVVGKPLASLGDIVKNGILVRPDEFLTAMDVLKLAQGTNDEVAADALNKRFWDVFNKRQWTETVLAVAYMKQDDYDRTAYYKLLEESSTHETRVFGRGWLGRHNDESALVIGWFVRQYKRILKDYFGKDNV